MQTVFKSWKRAITVNRCVSVTVTSEGKKKKEEKDISQNIFFYVLQKKEIYTGLERHSRVSK